MKKLVLGVALVIGSFINAQKIEMSIQYFNTVSFQNDIDASKLVQPEFDPHFDSTLVLLDLNLKFDLDSKQLIRNLHNDVNNTYEFLDSINIIDTKIINNVIYLSLDKNYHYDNCQIYTDSKKIIFYNNTNGEINGIFADEYDSIKLFFD